MRLHLFFLIPAFLLLAGMIVNFFLPQKHDAFLIWAGYSLLLYFLVIFGLLTVLTPLPSFVKAGIAVALPVLAGFSLLQVVVGSNPVTGGYSAALYVLAPGAVVERTVSKLGHAFQDYRIEKALPDLCRTGVLELSGHPLVHAYLQQVEGRPDGKLLLLHSVEGPRLSDYYTQKTANRLTRLFPDGTEDPDFALNRACVVGTAFALSPDGKIIVSSPWAIGPQQPAFLYDSSGNLLVELRPDQEINVRGSLCFSNRGTLYGLRGSEPYGGKRTLSLVELTLEPKPKVRVVRDLTPVIEHGNEPWTMDLWIGPEGDFRVLMENRSGSNAGRDFYLARMKPGGGPLSFQQLPRDTDWVLGTFFDGTLVLQRDHDHLGFLSGTQLKTVKKQDWISMADPALADNYDLVRSDVAVLPGDRLAFIGGGRRICALITDRNGRKLGAFGFGEK